MRTMPHRARDSAAAKRQAWGGLRGAGPAQGAKCAPSGGSAAAKRQAWGGHQQSGIALVLALWLTVLLTVLASGFAFSMRSEALATRNAVSLARARALADGAIFRTAFELSRYLDYCSEMLSVISKAAALYVQEFDDPITLEAVNDVEQLTGSLSQKLWLKIDILERVAPLGGAGARANY